MPIPRKPSEIFDRDHEWRWLADFATASGPGPRLAFVFGRRRQGKSLLIRSLAKATGGVYHAAVEQERLTALTAIGTQLAERAGFHAPLAFPDWDAAIGALFDLGRDSRPLTVVIDEFPFLVAGDRSLPSIIQHAFDRATFDRSSSVRLVLCGSAISVMERLFSGSAPLYGRASTQLLLHPFDFRTAAAFWGLERSPELAFRVHAILGGTPAYRGFARERVPSSLRSFDAWVRDVVLHPAGTLLREAAGFVAEEPTISDRALYHSILAAIASGRTRTGEIAAALGRPQTALAHPLRVLEELRLVAHQEDAFRRRRAAYRLAEPLVRFFEAVVVPHTRAIGFEQAAEAWPRATAASFSSLVLGPHFEEMAREWVRSFASERTRGGGIRTVAPTIVADPDARESHQVDVVVVPDLGERRIARAIGEAKWSDRPMPTSELRRLERIRLLMSAKGQADGSTKLLLFGGGGFSPALQREAAVRDDVELIDLERLYHGE